MRTIDDHELIVAVITATILFFLFAAFTVSYLLLYRRRQKQYEAERQLTQKEVERQILQSRVEVQEATFQHISQELHDNVAQLLGTTKMLIGVTGIKLEDPPPSLTTADTTLTKAIQELRHLSRSLNREWLERFDFSENLKDEVERINTAQILEATIAGNTHLDMPAGEQLLLFRIVQEAIQNALRHAAPQRLAIAITAGEELQVQIINDGKPLPSHFEGMGTNNMRHRARLFGGTVTWDSGQDETIVTIRLPLNRKA